MPRCDRKRSGSALLAHLLECPVDTRRMPTPSTSLHVARLPRLGLALRARVVVSVPRHPLIRAEIGHRFCPFLDIGSTKVSPIHAPQTEATDRKSTRLNSSHVAISYAVFC